MPYVGQVTRRSHGSPPASTVSLHIANSRHSASGGGAIRHGVTAERLHPFHVGVYAVGHTALSARGRLLGAVLACGRGALLSHRSAAAHLELLPSARSTVEVTTIRGRTRSGRPGIVVHQVRHLHPADRFLRDGIPVTSVARTLLDLAEVVPLRQLERAFEEAERLRVLDLGALEQLCARSRGRRGLRPLGSLLSVAQPSVSATRSELERRFLRLCREADLPTPSVNALVAGLEVDAVWWNQRLVVELDGHAFHGTRAAFERDRIRDAALQLAGYRVLRVTYRRLEAEPGVIIGTVRSLLGDG